MMARKKPDTVKSLSDYFKQPDLGAADSRYNQGGERQSEAYPSARSTPKPSAPKARPAAASPRRPGGGAPSRPTTKPLPPRRPPGGGGEKVPDPRTAPIPYTQPPDVNLPPPPMPMPQYDPMGTGPTGPMAPPAPGSSTQGYPVPPQPTDMIPPMTGPGSDRMSAAVGPTQLGGLGSLPTGQSAASLLFGGGGGAPPMAPPPAAPAAGPVMPPPQTGPQSDRMAPPGLLDSLGGGINQAQAALKRWIPPFGGV